MVKISCVCQVTRDACWTRDALVFHENSLLSPASRSVPPVLSQRTEQEREVLDSCCPNCSPCNLTALFPGSLPLWLCLTFSVDSLLILLDPFDLWEGRCTGFLWLVASRRSLQVSSWKEWKSQMEVTLCEICPL